MASSVKQGPIEKNQSGFLHNQIIGLDDVGRFNHAAITQRTERQQKNILIQSWKEWRPSVMAGSIGL